MNRILLLALLLFASYPNAYAQEPQESLIPEFKYPKAKVTEKRVASLDIARRIQRFDAAPDGKNWLVVDKFGQMESIVINGERFPREYNTIPATTARVSPNGEYLVWVGLTRSYTDDGFNSTLATLYHGKDSLTAYTADYIRLYFSPDGKDYGVTFPYANEKQPEDRNALVINGKQVSVNGPLPRDLALTTQGWYFRTGDDSNEYITTSAGTQLFRKRRVGVGADQPADSIVLHYSPMLRYNDAETRAVDFEIEQTTARQFRTSYRPKDQKNALVFLVTGEKGQLPSRWISNVMTDTSGKTFAYFACDPALNNKFTNRDERPGIVMFNGEQYDGPFPTVERLFLSPSGKHIAYSVGGPPRIFLNKKELGAVGMISSVDWSDDERHFAYATSNSRGKMQVIAGGKASPAYEHVGKIAWTKDGKFVEYMAVDNGKVFQVRQGR